MRDTGSEVAAPSRARFASIAAFGRSLRLSHAPTQLHQPRCDYALRPLSDALVPAAVAKAQTKTNDSNSDRQ
jgi:hypothetical protein